MARLLRDHGANEALQRFLDAVAFNWIIGGTDAHIRNCSLLVGSGASVRLAPLYDLTSSLGFQAVKASR
jgi:serine/threonine-protein kinase HipA